MDLRARYPAVEPWPGVAATDWNDWRWQVRQALKTKAQFARYFSLTAEEEMALEQGQSLFRAGTTPYYAQLARGPCSGNLGSKDPIRQMFLPQAAELRPGGQQMLDPLGERQHRPVARIIHRYPDRVLFLVTDICSVYCRYCTRKHFTGQAQAFPSAGEYEEALSYLRRRPAVREVILSGGDPLTVSDEKLENVLRDLRAIPHIEIIRIGSRMPVVCPMRVSDELAALLRRYAPVFVLTHFNHPRELTWPAAEALTRLVDHGVPVLNQLVLLRGVNNHPALIQALSRRLLTLRVKPYYMFQCDPSIGTEHFRTSVEESRAIQRDLWGRLSGLALPALSLDIPGGGGKVGLVPDFLVREDAEGQLYKGWDGITQYYREPEQSHGDLPADLPEYLNEWTALCGAPYGQEAQSLPPAGSVDSADS